MYDKLVAKVNNIDTSDFVLKTKYQANKTESEKKIPDLSNLVKKTKLIVRADLSMCAFWVRSNFFEFSKCLVFFFKCGFQFFN